MSVEKLLEVLTVSFAHNLGQVRDAKTLSGFLGFGYANDLADKIKLVARGRLVDNYLSVNFFSPIHLPKVSL